MIFGEAYTFYLQCKVIDGFDELQLIVYEYICSFPKFQKLFWFLELFFTANLTLCEMDLLRARGWLIDDQSTAVFMPVCRPDGSYVPEQCDSSIGQCWCVDKNGNELVGTRVSGSPACTSQCKFAILSLTRHS